MKNTNENKVKLKLTKDLLTASSEMTDNQARFLVDTYYQMQDARIRSSAQVRGLKEGDEPSHVMSWIEDINIQLEDNIKKALHKYALGHPVGQWSLGIMGIGPVISAGLLAYIDIKQAPTVGHIWRYAGQDPTCKWNKGEKRPWNANLKTLCWKMGECFVKVKNNDSDFYGKIFDERKIWESANNEKLMYKSQADEGAKRVGKTTEAYKSYSVGKLPAGHIHARAKRYAVKLFLSHWHDIAYRNHYKSAPPFPYPIAHMGHAHQIPVPNTIAA
tara:strand:- start:113 stop:931 length:819 start_codon:yes stop_codon:yes gene_type:complete